MEPDSPRSEDTSAERRILSHASSSVSGTASCCSDEFYNPKESWGPIACSNAPYAVQMWASGQRQWPATSDLPQRAEDTASQTSESSMGSDESSEETNPIEIDALRRQVHDMGRQIWQIQREHEQEKGALKCQCENKISEMRHQLLEKDQALAEHERRSEMLERQVAALQLKMQEMLNGCHKSGNDSPGSEDLSLIFARIGQSGEQDVGPSKRFCGRGQQPGSPTSCDAWHESSCETISNEDLPLPPKHLQHFSPLMMGRLHWAKHRRITVT